MSSEGSPPAPEGSTELGSAVPSSAPDSLLREVAHISEVAVGPVADGPEGRKLGHYLVGRRIGRGGMGDVYEATDARLGRKVALKVLPASFAASDERRRRFLREARAAAAVSHPNITVIYDVGEEGGTVFLAMELLTGRTLREALRAAGTFGLAEGARVVREIARGLGRAHEAGVVHRDLKPENVMIDGEGLVKILDFGLAKVVGPLARAPAGADATTEMVTAERRVLGTPNYMSPEQAVGDAIDQRTDIFSLGVMLYEMLSGRRPFVGNSTLEVLIKIARDEPTPLVEVLPGVPPDVEALVARCLAKRPADRFASCAELLAAIDALGFGPAGAFRGPSEPAPGFGRRPEPAPARRSSPSAPTLSRPPEPGPTLDDVSAVAPTQRAPSLAEVAPTQRAPSLAEAAPGEPSTPALAEAREPSTPALAEARGPSTPALAEARGPSTPALAEAREPAIVPGRTRVPSWRRRAPAVAVGAVALGALAVAGARLAGGPARSEGGPARPESATPPAAPEVLGCPPLAVVPATADPWLGAAVAQIVCDRVTILLGGRYDRTLPPAALLDLPRSPTSAFPNEPFAAPGATERALAAAKARAGRWLRGEVEATAAGYRVKLVLEGPAGPIDEREVRDVELPRAARAASMALAAGGALGARAEIDPGVADWLGASRVGELLAWQTLEEDEAGGLLTPQGACRDVEWLAAEVGPFGPLARIECALVAEARAPIAALPVDGSTPGRLARTSRYHRVSGGRTDPKALAADLRRAFAGASEPLGRAVLAGAESEMWLAGGEPDKARERGLVAVQSEPRSPLAWKALMNASVGEPGFGPIVRAHAGWHPDAPWGWRRLAEQPDANDPGATLASRRLKFARRAHQLVPHNVSFTYALGEQLVRSGEREEVRALAAPLLSGDQGERAAGETLMVLVDASVARFAAAYARGLRALEGGDSLSADGLREELFRRTMALASLLGRREEFADALVRRFFEPEPRLDRVGASPVIGVALCAAVRRPLAARCFERLERLVAERHFWMLLPSTLAALEGGKLFATGAYAKAAAAWRPIAGEENPATELLREPMAEAFERAGDATMAEIVDRPALAEAEMLHGATAAHVRAARRAAKRGDRDEARALASVVANAWATADVPPAALREMQALAGVRP